MNCHLVVDLKDNEFGPVGFGYVIGAMRVNCHITTLYIDGEQHVQSGKIGSDFKRKIKHKLTENKAGSGMSALGEALRANSTLKVLNVARV